MHVPIGHLTLLDYHN